MQLTDIHLSGCELGNWAEELGETFNFSLKFYQGNKDF